MLYYPRKIEERLIEFIENNISQTVVTYNPGSGLTEVINNQIIPAFKNKGYQALGINFSKEGVYEIDKNILRFKKAISLQKSRFWKFWSMLNKLVMFFRFLIQYVQLLGVKIGINNATNADAKREDNETCYGLYEHIKQSKYKILVVLDDYGSLLDNYEEEDYFSNKEIYNKLDEFTSIIRSLKHQRLRVLFTCHNSKTNSALLNRANTFELPPLNNTFISWYCENTELPGNIKEEEIVSYFNIYNNNINYLSRIIFRLRNMTNDGSKVCGNGIFYYNNIIDESMWLLESMMACIAKKSINNSQRAFNNKDIHDILSFQHRINIYSENNVGLKKALCRLQNKDYEVGEVYSERNTKNFSEGYSCPFSVIYLALKYKENIFTFNFQQAEAQHSADWADENNGNTRYIGEDTKTTFKIIILTPDQLSITEEKYLKHICMAIPMYIKDLINQIKTVSEHELKEKIDIPESFLL